MNEFYIICKQHRIEIPDIRIDKKELKQLDLNLPSVLDEFKASRGISFVDQFNSLENNKALEGKKSGTTQQFMAYNSKDKLNQTKNQPIKKTSPRK